jgi:hypothetical protein
MWDCDQSISGQIRRTIENGCRTLAFAAGEIHHSPMNDMIRMSIDIPDTTRRNAKVIPGNE